MLSRLPINEDKMMTKPAEPSLQLSLSTGPPLSSSPDNDQRTWIQDYSQTQLSVAAEVNFNVDLFRLDT